jgi:hypothetical protein
MCSCKKYEEIEMPCVHKVASCKYFKITAFQLFNPFYNIEVIKKIYEVDMEIPPFNPINLISTNVLPFKSVELNLSKERISNVGLD